MLKVVELVAGAICAVCALILLTINMIRFVAVFSVAALLVFCCVGGIVLWASGA